MQNENCAAETEYLLQQAASASTLSSPQNEARCAIKSPQMFGFADES
jgi:hypothetical protein